MLNVETILNVSKFDFFISMHFMVSLFPSYTAILTLSGLIFSIGNIFDFKLKTMAFAQLVFHCSVHKLCVTKNVHE
jgi:hypothetical protein